MFKRLVFLIAILCLPASIVLADFKGGVEAYRKGDYKAAFQEWEVLAVSGHTKAQSNMGLLYLRGQGVQKDEEAALEWFEKAAEQGLITAQFNLGILYSRIDGKLKSQTKSTEWYVLAAEAGHATARYHLAQRFEHGRGTERDFVEALRWAILASETAKGRLKDKTVQYRDKLLEKMPRAQIEKATQLAADTKGR